MKANVAAGATGFFKRAIDMLFIKNPRGTSVGVFFGIVAQGATKVLAPLLSQQQVVDFEKAGTIYYMCFGVFLFNIRALFRRRNLDPRIEEALAAIDLAKREGKLSAAQTKLMYVALLNKVLEQVTLDQDTQQKANRLRRAARPGGRA